MTISMAWLGGFQNSSGEDEPWRWSDGSAWDFENWLEGNPNNDGPNGGGEDYLQVNYGQHATWNDNSLAGRRRVDGYVCQYKG